MTEISFTKCYSHVFHNLFRCIRKRVEYVGIANYTVGRVYVRPLLSVVRKTANEC